MQDVISLNKEIKKEHELDIEEDDDFHEQRTHFNSSETQYGSFFGSNKSPTMTFNFKTIRNYLSDDMHEIQIEGKLEEPLVNNCFDMY